MTYLDEAVEALMLEVGTGEEDDSELRVVNITNRKPFEMAHLP